MSNASNALPKASLDTRKLAGSDAVAYAALVADIRARFEATNADETAIKRDALIGRISAALMLKHNAEKGLTGAARLKRETFEGEAEALLFTPGNSTDNRVVAANKWFNRVRTDAGHPSPDKRGGARVAVTKKAATTSNTQGVVDAAQSKVTAIKVPDPAKLTKVGAVEIGQAFRMAMLKSLSADPAIFEVDDYARRIKESMSVFMSTIYLIGKASEKKPVSEI